MRTEILVTDLKNVFRDKSLWLIFALPLFVTLILRFLPPIYESYFPEALNYRPLILGFFCLLASTLAGFLLAFVMLDEKDQQLFEVFSITPLNLKGLLKYRIGLMTVLGAVFAFLIAEFSGLVDLHFFQALGIALSCSLAAPINTLFIVGLANNKIEGVTYYKLANFILIIPLIGMFLSGPLKYVFGVIPFFWIYLGVDTLSSPVYSMCSFGAAFLGQLVLVMLAIRYFNKRNFK